MNFFKNCTTIAEAKTLFRTLAHQLHPDKSGGDTEEAFKAMLNEFENLSFTKEQDKYYEHAGDNKDFADIINELMTNPNYAGIEFEVIGSWVWLSGDTKPVKDYIKGLIEDKDENSYVCRWMNKKARWVFRPKGYRKFTSKEFSIDEIRNMHGSTKYKHTVNAISA